MIRLVRFEEADNQLARLLEQANKLNRADLKAITQTNIGLLRLNQGRVDLAEEELHIAIKNFDKLEIFGTILSLKSLKF